MGEPGGHPRGPQIENRKSGSERRWGLMSSSSSSIGVVFSQLIHQDTFDFQIGIIMASFYVSSGIIIVFMTGTLGFGTYVADFCKRRVVSDSFCLVFSHNFFHCTGSVFIVYVSCC